MHRTFVAIGCLMLLAACVPRAAENTWAPVRSSLMTRWAADVDPAAPLPEYPRPQMVREGWFNLNGLWHFAVNPGASIRDASGNGHVGRTLGRPAYVDKAGPDGRGAFAFNGTDDAIAVPVVARGDFTLALWVNTGAPARSGRWFAGNGLIDGECPGVTNDFGLVVLGRQAAFGIGNPDTTIHSTTEICDGKWHHVAATREQHSGHVRLFVDGRCEATAQGTTQPLDAPQRLLIGRIQTDINPFTGKLRDVRIYNSALPDNAVAALANPRAEGRADATPFKPAGWWPLDRDYSGDPEHVDWDGRILVPFPIESALSGVRRPLRPGEKLLYRRTFSCPDLSGGRRLLLHFGAVDWASTVRVNGRAIGAHRGGYDPFSFDITDAVKAGAENTIDVDVTDSTGANGEPKGKQNLNAMQRPGGTRYTPSSGIWQTVWLETVPSTYLTALTLIPDVDANALRVTATAAGDTATAAGDTNGLVVTVDILDGERIAATASGTAGTAMTIKIPEPKLWWPDAPFLYGITVAMKRGDTVIDTVRSYCGLRKISLEKDAGGVTRIMLNNRFVFQAGPLDQGFWPDGIYTAPTDAALRYDIEATKRLGFNMARKHVKVEPARWYYWCDTLGLLVWQDMPSGGAGRGAKQTTDGEATSPECARQFETELQAMIGALLNHPSIVIWVLFNEGWGQYDTARLTQWIKTLDPSRLVCNASGWHDRKIGDIVDRHAYPGPAAPDPEPTRAAVLGEFGGLGLTVAGHTWAEKAWGYRQLAGGNELTARFIELWKSVHRLRDEKGLSAAVYTQTTDVETECNGLMTYDRDVIKLPPATVAPTVANTTRPAAKN